MFCGCSIDRMSMNNIGWGILIGWTIWVFILPAALEVIDYKLKQIKSPISGYSNIFIN